jgi:enamine deaminase RidA (YjgF/YER057c/UK114 family)
MSQARAAGPYERLKELGIVLPEAPAPVANFVPAVRTGDLLFLSGQGPVLPGRVRHVGKVGADVSVEQAYDHARITTVNLLAVMHEALGSLERVTRIVKVLGMVNSTAGFTDHPRVINGCSDLLIAVFGEDIGRHARSAVGMGSLPGQITVEIELVAAVRA